MAVNVFSVESMVGTRVRRSVGFLIGSADETRRDVTGFVLMAISKATVSRGSDCASQRPRQFVSVAKEHRLQLLSL